MLYRRTKGNQDLNCKEELLTYRNSTVNMLIVRTAKNKALIGIKVYFCDLSVGGRNGGRNVTANYKVNTNINTAANKCSGK